ncbi:hypothetical protein RND81_13G172100 [Saponaria officinalis]|uniref:Ubiquitin-like domain-containing protein n=1 Tax=Saponaria officinalis TaxID=3572 RepID=A0AAW1H4Q1_SAPOF
MDPQNSDQFSQIFVRSPHLQTLTLTLTLNQTVSNLKSIIFPNSPHNDAVFLSFNGKTLPDTANLTTLGIRPWSTVLAHVKAAGGGGDGGATGAESRDCYLNMYAEKKPDKVDPNEKLLSKWTTCALSSEPLKPPCVVDRLGNLFNKEALVKALLGKNLPKAFRHIKGLKDMITVHLAEISEKEGTTNSCDSPRFQCPVTGLEFNGKCKFFALSKCGHVVSAKALKEIKSNSCLVCYTEFEDCYTDKIVINGNDEEVAAMKVLVEQQLQSTVSKSSKKKKKDVESKVDNGGGNAPVAKRFKAVDVAPPNANKEVYASIFISSRKSEFKETYSCRSLPLGRN